MKWNETKQNRSRECELSWRTIPPSIEEDWGLHIPRFKVCADVCTLLCCGKQALELSALSHSLFSISCRRIPAVTRWDALSWHLSCSRNSSPLLLSCPCDLKWHLLGCACLCFPLHLSFVPLIKHPSFHFSFFLVNPIACNLLALFSPSHKGLMNLLFLRSSTPSFLPSTILDGSRESFPSIPTLDG